LFYVHLKNFSSGKTTNERFSRKAHNSFSEIGGGDTTTNLDRSESESMAENEGDRDNSIVEDDQKPGRKSSKKERRASFRRPRKTCLQNWRLMMCQKRIVTQRELYDRQVN
jgi:hypothetical protein